MQIDPSYLPKLRDYYAKHHVIPSYAAMGRLWGIAAKSWVANCVGRLKEEGYLKAAPDKRLGPGRRFFERPLAGSKVAAGFPSPATEDLHDTITIDEYLVRHPSQTVLVTVKGDSMIDSRTPRIRVISSAYLNNTSRTRRNSSGRSYHEHKH